MSLIDKLREKYKKIDDIVNSCMFSDITYNSIHNGFTKNPDNKYDRLKSKDINKDINRIDEFGKNIITDLIKIIDEPEREVYYDTLSILSWNTILNMFDYKKRNGQKRVLDFAYLYIGMGHIYVYFIDLETNKLYRRRDGGSNYYDRLNNFNNICKFDGNIDSKESKDTNTELYKNIIDIFDNVNIYDSLF